MAQNDDSEVWPASEPNRTIMVKARSHDRLTAIRELFISGHAEDVLPPALAEYAKQGRAVSRDSWPRWLVFDVALRYCQEALERDLGLKNAPAVPVVQPSPVNEAKERAVNDHVDVLIVRRQDLVGEIAQLEAIRGTKAALKNHAKRIEKLKEEIAGIDAELETLK